MKTAVLQVTPFVQNCTLVWCAETMKGAVIDPGGDVDRIVEAADSQGVTVERLLITHGHVDHAAGAAELAQRIAVPIEGPHRGDRLLLENLPTQAQQFGLPPALAFEPDRWLEDGDTVNLGEVELEVLHCPGHSPGHLVYYNAHERLALVGDVLFQGSIGRTDLPGGDMETLLRSIRERLWPLGDDVGFIPGHGPPSDFGTERRTNPFVGEGASTPP